MTRKAVVACLAAILIVALVGADDRSTSAHLQEPAFEAATLFFEGRPIRSLAMPANSPPEVAAAVARADFRWHGEVAEDAIIAAPPGNALVAKYLAQYTGEGGRRWLEAVMKRGEPYLPFIRSEIARRGMPPELAYLPVIESAFSATAVSKSGAVGLWQFMRNSIGPFGMRVDDWTDDRRDFWKATDAALRKLQENYTHFKDWPLALAAYNAGLGAVGRAVAAAGVKDYWELCARGKLKTETVHYVPKFIAAAAVLSRAGRSGLELGWPEDPRWTRVEVKKTVDLGLLAEKANIPITALRTGNAELRYGVTPPDPGYRLKVPAAYAQSVEEVLARKDLQLIKYYFHTVRSGDTLSALSRHFGVTVDLIERSNPGLKARYLQIGARVLIPALKEAGPYKPDRAGAVIARFDGEYVVKKGDTLWSIALAHDIDPEQLAEANSMELDSVLREGRRLKTPILVAETLE